MCHHWLWERLPLQVMPTHAEVIAQNPLEAPADFWTNVYYVFNGLAAFCTVLLFFGTFVCCCLTAISRIEQWERSGEQQQRPAEQGKTE